jgi:hypothetical protein
VRLVARKNPIGVEIIAFSASGVVSSGTMLTLLHVLVMVVKAALTTRADLVIENLALRQQVAVLKEKRPKPSLLHVNVTANPRSAWVVQQLREAFPGDDVPSHLIHDRDSIFSDLVDGAAMSMGITPSRGLPPSCAGAPRRRLPGRASACTRRL